MADHHRGHSTTLTKLGLGALAFNSGLAIYNSWRDDDAASVGFVLLADAALLLLFLCLRQFELEHDGARGRDTKIRAAVWALTAMFASRVAPLMPTPVAVGVWVMAVATAAGGFWAFFFSVD